MPFESRSGWQKKIFQKGPLSKGGFFKRDFAELFRCKVLRGRAKEADSCMSMVPNIENIERNVVDEVLCKGIKQILLEKCQKV